MSSCAFFFWTKYGQFKIKSILMEINVDIYYLKGIIEKYLGHFIYSPRSSLLGLALYR